MNNIIWKRVRPLMQIDSLTQFEKDYKVKLPEKFKKFITKNNGGRPNLDIIKMSNGRELEIKCLLSFNKEDVENIFKVMSYFENHFKCNIIPFAIEPSGDYFCIDLGDNSIVYWEHENNMLNYIRKDINEFLNSLYKL